MKRLAWLSAALLTTAAAGVPLAHADDHHYDNDRHGDRDRDDRDRRVDEGRRGDVRHDVQRADWVPLANMEIARKETVDIDPRAGRFSHLRLHALRGVAYVDFITVRLGNGEQTHVDIKRRIGRDEDIDVDLPGGQRRVEAITVHGQPDRWSRIQIIGMR